MMQTVTIQDEGDIVEARRVVRDFAKEMGFGIVDQTKIATATSELARNIFRYAGKGLVELQDVLSPHGMRAIFSDEGPGIENVSLAMQEGFTTTQGSLGLGLPGTQRLVDEMKIESTPGKGTKVIIFKKMP